MSKWEKIPGGVERRIIEPMTFHEQIDVLDKALSTEQRNRMLDFMREHQVEDEYLAIVQSDEEGEAREQEAVALGIAIFATVPDDAWPEFREILGPLTELFDAAIETVKKQMPELL